jgi:Ser-tRNA(Ala) deacylase AlaX
MDLHVQAFDRLVNARNHTAGHVIDLAIQLLPYKRPAIKANHAPGESWIQFNGDQLPSGESVDDVKRALATQVDSLINANLRVSQMTPLPEAVASLGISAPPGKSVRVVAFEGYESFARGCGGTHVGTTAEVGRVVITGVRARKGILSVTYQTEAEG